MLGGDLRRLLRARALRLHARCVAEVLWELAARSGPDLARRLFEDPAHPEPELHRDLRVLVNGRDVRFLAGPRTPLAERDRVTLHLAGARSFPGG